MKTRVSAYALAIHDEKILLTQLAPQCFRAGHWTLPGGGIDHGEQPVETVVREVYEETSLDATELALFHAMTFSETSDRGQFLGVQIVYRATASGTPRVIEQGGSTAAAAWFPLAEVAGLPTVPMVDAVLAQVVG